MLDLERKNRARNLKVFQISLPGHISNQTDKVALFKEKFSEMLTEAEIVDVKATDIDSVLFSSVPGKQESSFALITMLNEGVRLFLLSEN